MLPPAGHGLRIVCIALFMFCALHIVEGKQEHFKTSLDSWWNDLIMMYLK